MTIEERINAQLALSYNTYDEEEVREMMLQIATEQEQIDKNIIKSILGSIIILAQDQTISNIVKEIEIFAMIENALEESK